MTKKKSKFSILPIIYLLFGLYFVNFGFTFFNVPEGMNVINKWIITVGGMLFFIAFYRSIIFSKNRIIRRALK